MKYIRRWSRISLRARSRFVKVSRTVCVFQKNFVPISRRKFGTVLYRWDDFGFKPVNLMLGPVRKFVGLACIQGKEPLVQGVIYALLGQLYSRQWFEFCSESFFYLWKEAGRFGCFREEGWFDAKLRKLVIGRGFKSKSLVQNRINL